MLKNIVIVANSATLNGGATAVAVDTASLLAECKYNVYFFVGTGEPDAKLVSNKNIKIISTGQYDILSDKNRIRAMCNGIYNFKSEKMFRQLLSTLNKEETVIHIHTWTQLLSSSIFKVAHESGFKVFVTLHDYFLVCPTGGFYNFSAGKICELAPMSMKCILCNCDQRHYYHKIWRVMRQYVQNRVILSDSHTGYIFISEFSRRQFLRRMPAPTNQFLIRNPIYFADRFRIQAEKNSFFTFIGRLSPEKGIREFCKAIHDAGVKGVAIGDGVLRGELEAKYSSITFTGWLDKAEIREWLKKTRCIVFPSVLYEVSPLVPPEVNAYGIPVISSDCTAASDNAAFVYHSADDLVNLIKNVSEQDIKQLSEEIYSKFDESVTTEYTDKLLEIYSTPLK